MNILPTVHSQEAALRVDVQQRTLRGRVQCNAQRCRHRGCCSVRLSTGCPPRSRRWTDLRLTPAKDAHRLGLHAFGLRVLAVSVDGAPAAFEHRPQVW